MSLDCRRLRLRASLLSLATLGTTTLAATTARADTWTVLTYVAADNNLEREAIENIRQMMKVGSTGNVKVAVQLDRSLRYSQESLEGVANFKGTKRLRIDAGRATELQDVGNPDGTQPATIGDFIKWGMATFPSDHYAVVLWDHGSGWKGCCEDESSPGRDYTPLNDMTEGLRLGLEGSGRQKYDLIGFDECLMGGIEVAHAIQPFGKVMVASTETEPGQGWDYEPFLRSITQNPSVDPAGVGKAIADGYHVFNDSDSDHTLSVVDLERIPALVASIDQLSDTLGPAAAIRETWTPMARARSRAEKYGSSGFSDPLAAIDLGNFLDGLADEPAAKPSADAVKSALSAAVLHKVQGSGHARQSGLSIHLPQKGANAEYLGIGYAKTRWPAFIGNYAIGSGTDVEPPDVGPPEVDPPSDGGSSGGGGIPTVLGPINLGGLSHAGDADLANLFLAADAPGGGSTFLGALPAILTPDGRIRSSFDGRWPTLSDGAHEGFAPFFPISTSRERGGAQKMLLAMVADLSDTAGGYRPGVVVFKYDPATREAAITRAYTVDLLKGFGAVDLVKDVPKVRPWSLTVQSFGLPTPAPGGTEYDGATLAVKTKALAKGAYQVGFLVSDLAGNVATNQTRVNVDVPKDPAPNADNGNSDGTSGSDKTSSITCGVAHSPASPASDVVTMFGALGALVLLRARRQVSRRPASPDRRRSAPSEKR